MTEELKLRAPDDLHVHFRDGPVLMDIARYTSAVFRRALVMPNLTPPVLTADDAFRYKERVLAATGGSFEPFMTIKLTESTTQDDVRLAKEAGVVAGKLYPEGVTTNSQDGVRELGNLWPVFAAMERFGLVLSLHGERPGVFCMGREAAFLEDLRLLSRSFPEMRIVLEHVTTADAVRAVRKLPPNVSATITAHHLVYTLDDVVGGTLNPHAFCKPIPKTPEDRSALLTAATNSELYGGKFFFGSDTAPHLRGAKECASGCAGVFSAPCALESLASVFESERALDRLEFFTSVAGARFYGLPLNEEFVTLSREQWTVPGEIAGVVPFLAGLAIPWRFLGRDRM